AAAEFRRLRNIEANSVYRRMRPAKIGSEERSAGRRIGRWNEPRGKRHALRRHTRIVEHRNARGGEPAIAVEYADAQEIRIVLRIVYFLGTLAALIAETENRRAILHDTPRACVVARLHAHPGDEILLGRLQLHGIVKRRRAGNLDHELRVPPRREALFVYDRRKSRS